ncbi:hypothetical protein [Ammoniphilus resinae]|uniref:Uncharacterized protein n=1 Tax=Ammoniphilus resinae TaxID=861532 RepID=A0ABS4GLK1_9BACL|nr:hypothetical protein [Ammoniphilus resinae]MBP1931119.1 hypothetical protein [Ammoniphilus resinae]
MYQAICWLWIGSSFDQDCEKMGETNPTGSWHFSNIVGDQR